jgi:hypothetical protein
VSIPPPSSETAAMPTRHLLYASTLLLFSAAVFGAQAPSSAPIADVSAIDRSFTQGDSVSHPESLSGLWEAPDGKGGAVGIYLQLSTTVPGATTTLVGTTQSWVSLSVALYRRRGATLNISNEEANFFADSPRGGGVHFEHERLTLHFKEYDLDLHHTPADEWTGRFHRREFDENVTLKRPSSGSRTTSWIVGTWRETDSPFRRCLHIFQTAAGGFTGWSDTLETLGDKQYSPGMTHPATALESYGELAKVDQSAPNTFFVELYAFSALCCSHTFIGTSSGSGRMAAEWPEGANQAPYKTTFVKVPGDSCIAPEAAAKRP